MDSASVAGSGVGRASFSAMRKAVPLRDLGVCSLCAPRHGLRQSQRISVPGSTPPDGAGHGLLAGAMYVALVPEPPMGVLFFLMVVLVGWLWRLRIAAG